MPLLPILRRSPGVVFEIEFCVQCRVQALKNGADDHKTRFEGFEVAEEAIGADLAMGADLAIGSEGALGAEGTEGTEGAEEDKGAAIYLMLDG